LPPITCLVLFATDPSPTQTSTLSLHDALPILTADHVLTARVFRAVQEIHGPVLHHGRRIEGGVLLPPDHGVAQGRAEPGCGTGGDRRVHRVGFFKGTEHPLLPWHGAGRGQQHEDDGREALQRAALARSVTAATRVRTGPSTTG